MVVEVIIVFFWVLLFSLFPLLLCLFAFSSVTITTSLSERQLDMSDHPVMTFVSFSLSLSSLYSSNLLSIPFKQNASTLRQIALARMLVIVSTIFILTSSPIIALSITQSVVDDFFINRRYTNIFLLCHIIYLELGIINSSGINFFVYVLRSSRFRQELARFVCFRFLMQKGAGLKKEDVTLNTMTTGTSAVCSSQAL